MFSAGIRVLGRFGPKNLLNKSHAHAFPVSFILEKEQNIGCKKLVWLVNF